MDAFKIIVVAFGVGTIALVALSWRSLREPTSHGFFRFFAFEGILLLILLNIRFWVQNPFSPLQLISWCLLIASGFLVVRGVYLLHHRGRPTSEPSDGPEFRFERTSQLVTTGVYRYIRHPLYASLLYLAWGAFLKSVSWLTFSITLCVTVFLFLTAKVEERENVQRFGESYHDYMVNTKMFIPYIW